MGTPARTSARDAVVHAAAEVFAERGYEGVRIQEIARRAGVSTGAIYAHFRGRHDLLVATIDRYSGTVAQEQMAGYDDERGTAADALAGVGIALARDPDVGMRPLAIEALVAARREPELAALMRSRVEDSNAQLEALVQRGQVDGSIARDVDPAALARFANALVVGVAMLAPVWEKQLEPVTWDALVRRLVAALAPVSDR